MSPPRSVVLIEDDEVLGASLAQRLRLEGVGVRLARTLAEGEALLRAGPRPSLVLCDMRLPGGSGEDLIARLLPELGAVPVVAMTAYGGVDQAVRLMRAGADDYLTKPFPIEAVLDKLATLGAAETPRSGRGRGRCCSTRRPRGRCSAMPGRAMCGSCATGSSAPRSLPPGPCWSRPPWPRCATRRSASTSAGSCCAAAGACRTRPAALASRAPPCGRRCGARGSRRRRPGARQKSHSSRRIARRQGDEGFQADSRKASLILGTQARDRPRCRGPAGDRGIFPAGWRETSGG